MSIYKMMIDYLKCYDLTDIDTADLAVSIFYFFTNYRLYSSIIL